MKIKKPYIGNSKTTKYRKYGPSGEFTKAAKLSQPITNFFQILLGTRIIYKGAHSF
jgi:hypothetical protein